MDLSPAALERLAWRRRHSGKDCPKCGRALPLSAFGVDSRKPDGLEDRCRECEAGRARARRLANRSPV